MSKFYSLNNQHPNIYNKNNLNSQSDKGMKIYGVLGDNKKNHQMSESPLYANKMTKNNRGNAHSYGPLKVIDMNKNNNM